MNGSIINASFYTLFQAIVENMIGQDAILRIVNAQMSAARLSEAISWSISYDHTVQSPRQSQAGGAMPGAPGGRRNFERCARHAFVRDIKILRLYNCAADRTAPRAKTPGAPSVEAPAVKAPGQQRSEPLPKFVRAALIARSPALSSSTASENRRRRAGSVRSLRRPFCSRAGACRGERE